VLAGYLYNELTKGNLNKILFIATGALLSPISSQQGESIPGIAHAVTIQNTLE
jgi:stage V sporulation protein AD